MMVGSDVRSRKRIWSYIPCTPRHTQVPLVQGHLMVPLWNLGALFHQDELSVAGSNTSEMNWQWLAVQKNWWGPHFRCREHELIVHRMTAVTDPDIGWVGAVVDFAMCTKLCVQRLSQAQLSLDWMLFTSGNDFIHERITNRLFWFISTHTNCFPTQCVNGASCAPETIWCEIW